MKRAAKTEPESPEEEIPFEAALGKLESIVEAMETEELALEQLLARYEEGTRLVAACQKKLAQAELKIQQLREGEGGLESQPVEVEDSEPQ